MDLTINPEFQNLIPPLTDDERSILEKSIINEGCRDALITWNDTVVDGHNRYEICRKHNIDFKTLPYEFESDQEAKIWIIDNQKGRRNITDGWKWELAQIKKAILIEKGKLNISANKGGTTTLSQVDKEAGHNTQKELAKELNWSTGKVAMADKVWKETDDYTKEKIKKGEETISGAYRKLTEQNRKKELKERRIERINNYKEMEIPDRVYRIIYADPPWKYNDKCEGGGVQGGGVEIRHYATMTIDDLCNIKLPQIDADAVLFLWVTSPLLEDAFKIINSWGFKYKSSFVWDKVKHNMGHYNSVRHELLLICTKGSCTPDNVKLFDSVQSIEKTEHSKKPEEFRNIIDTLYPYGNRIELFARVKVENWDAWGNEL